MAFEGGYTSALNSQTARNATDSATQRALQWLALEQQQIAQKQAQTQQQDKLAAKQWELNAARMGPPQGAQPPPPGQSSQPMIQPPQGGAPAGPMGAPPGMGAGMQAMMSGAPPGPAAPAQQPQPQPAMQQPMPGQGWRPSPSAGPALGGAPPQQPQGPQGSPSAPMPSGPPGGIEMPQLQSFDQLFAQVQKMPGLSDTERERVLEAGAVQMDKQNKEKLEAWKLTTEVKTAQKKAANEAEQEVYVKKLGLPAGSTIPPGAKEAIIAAGGDVGQARKMLQLQQEKKATIAGGGEGDWDQQDVDYWTKVLQKGGNLPPRLAYTPGGKKLVADLMHGVSRGDTSPTEMLANQAEFMGQKAGERTLGTRSANIEMAATEARSLAKLALEASRKVDRTGIKSVNDLIQAAEKRTASPELRAFVAANTSLINAYARAINPQGVGTVADKEHAREMLDTAFSKGDYEAGVNQLLLEIDAARKSPQTVKSSMREDFTGKPGDKAGSGTKTVTTKAQYDALPVGTHFFDKDGKEWIRH